LTVVVVLVIIYGVSAPLLGKLPAGDISSALGRDSTLTGRSAIWGYLVPLALSRPILGHGWVGFWTKETRESFYFFPAHNGYLETILATGFVGLLFIGVFMISSCRKALRELRTDYVWGVLWVCWLIMVLLHNVTESSLPNLANSLIGPLIWFTLNGSRGDQGGSSAGAESLE